MPALSCAGLVAATLGTWRAAGRLSSHPEVQCFGVLDNVVASGTTWYTAVPTNPLAGPQQGHDMEATPSHNLRFVRSCSAPLPVAPVRGPSEGPTRRRPTDDRSGAPNVVELLLHTIRRAGTVGGKTGESSDSPCPLLTTTGTKYLDLGESGGEVRGVRLVDGLTASQQPRGERGEFQETGWFRTENVGTKSEDAPDSCRCGRRSSFKRRAGDKVSPYKRSKRCLLEHPAVSEARRPRTRFPIPSMGRR